MQKRQRTRYVQAETELLERDGKETVVLEKSKRAQIESQGQDEKKPAQCGTLTARHCHGRDMARNRAGRNKPQKPPVLPAVEKVAGSEHERLPGSRTAGKKPVQGKNDDKKYGET